VFTLVFVSREAGVKFFRFNAGLAAILLAVALCASSGRNLVDRCRTPGRPRSVVAERRSRLLGDRRRVLASCGRSIAGTAVLGGLVALVRRRSISVRLPSQVLDRRELPELGGAARRRLHGDDPRHWYLVIPSLQVSTCSRSSRCTSRR
jgi:hypothetical protein